MKKLLAVASLALVLFTAACSSDSTGPSDEPEEPSPEQVCIANGGRWLYPGETASWYHEISGYPIVYTVTNDGTRPACYYDAFATR